MLKIGSRIAWFGGKELWLGYEPRMIDGRPYIHSVDAQKAIQPLLTPVRLSGSVGRTIVLDAGHGGKDGGAHSCVNLELEKHYTLDWATRLRPLLEAAGWRVVMTRSNDFDLPLSERVARAELVGADLFVSLHFNSGAGNHELSGVETYCLPATGMPSSLLRGYGDDVHSNFPNNAYDEQNVQWAYQLHRSVVARTGAEDRGVRRARFMGVLRGQRRPAVLIEGGYLTNTKEARRISSPNYRQSLAEAVAQALK